MSEYNCCHGTPETGHSPTCPYDKEFFGPTGVHFRKAAGPACYVDFHAEGGSMAKSHGPNSKYAQNLRRQAEDKLRA